MENKLKADFQTFSLVPEGSKNSNFFGTKSSWNFFIRRGHMLN